MERAENTPRTLLKGDISWLRPTDSSSRNQRMRPCICFLDPCLSPHKFSILYVPAKEEFVGNGQKFFIGR